MELVDLWRWPVTATKLPIVWMEGKRGRREPCRCLGVGVTSPTMMESLWQCVAEVIRHLAANIPCKRGGQYENDRN